jgi:hypothetical protein
MQKRSSNYERVILSLVALVAIAAAGWIIYMKIGFADTLSSKVVKPNNALEQPPMAKVDEAIKRAIEVPKPWIAPIRNNKAVPLNKAVLLAIKGEEVIDMYLENPLMREPMSNAFLRENDLDWQYPNVGEFDPDNDGFNNLEEFTKNTKPKDAASHPPVTDKLYLVERLSKDYHIVLKNSSGQVSVPDESGVGASKKNYFISLDKVGTEPAQFFGGTGDRFKAVKFEVKKMPDPKLGERDVSELTVEEIVTKRKIVLVMNVPTNLAEYSAKFEFRLKQVVDLAPVAKEGTFRIPGYEDTTYKVMDIQEDKAVICPLKADGTLGDEIIINKL